jgi:hypothetical protein
VLRSTPRRNEDGTEVRYLEFAHNVWDIGRRNAPRCRSDCNFGREDAATERPLQQLVPSVSRFLRPNAARAATGEGLEFAQSRPPGGIWALDGLWARLGIGRRRHALHQTSARSRTPDPDPRTIEPHQLRNPGCMFNCGTAAVEKPLNLPRQQLRSS